MRVESAVSLPAGALSVPVSPSSPPGADWQLPAADCGGGCHLSGLAGEEGLCWRTHVQLKSVLDITHFSLSGAIDGGSLRITFPATLFPRAAVVQGPSTVSIFVLTATGHLYQVALPCKASAPGSSIFKGVSPISGHIVCHDLGVELTALGQPSCLAAGEDALAIGGTSGTVVAFPLKGRQGAPGFEIGRATELKGTPWSIGELLPAVFGKATTPGVSSVALAPPLGASRGPLLVAMLSDGAITAWDLSRRSQLLYHAGPPSVGQGSTLRPSLLVATTSQSGGALWLAAAVSDSQGQGQVYTTKLHPSSAAAGSGASVGIDMQLEPFTKVTELDGRWDSSGRVCSLLRRSSGVKLEEAGPGLGVMHGRLMEEDMQEWIPTVDCPTDVELLLELGKQLPDDSSQIDLDSHFCDLMMAPHLISRAALQEALSYHGFTASTANESLQKLRETVLACVDAATERSPGMGKLGAWRGFLATYWAAWQLREAPVGLITPSGNNDTHATGVVRGRAGLGILRSATPLELLMNTRTSVGALATGLNGWIANDALSPASLSDVQIYAACAVALRRCLGPLASSLFLSLSRCGCDIQQQLLPAYVSLLAIGPSSGELPSDVKRRAAAKWRSDRRAAVFTVSTALSSLADPAGSAALFLQLVHLSPPAAETPGAAANGAVLTGMAWQVAAAQASSCRDLLILLSFQDCHLLPLAGTPTGPSAASLVPQGHAQLMAACLTLMLSGTSVSIKRSAVAVTRQEATAALKHLSLGEHGLEMSNGAFGPSSTLSGTTVELSAAQLMLPGFACPGMSGGAEMSIAACAFVSLLSGNSEGLAAPQYSKVIDAIVSAALTMLSQHPRQLGLVRSLVALSGSEASSAASLFLHGICAQLEDPHASGPALEAAVQPLLRVAQGLTSQPALMAKVAGLRAELTGTDAMEGVQLSEVDYHETMMLFFEQQGNPEAAARFARAAISACQAEGNSAPLGVLWSALFSYTAEAGSWEEAYMAMLANPDPEKYVQSLHQLLRQLMAAKRIDVICSLPWSDVRSLKAQDHPIPMIEEVQNYLRRWSDESDINDSPQPYLVLYDLCVARGDFQFAAEAQLCLARRIVLDSKASGASGLRAVSAALLAAHDTLSLLDTEQAWVEEPLGGHGSLMPAGAVPGPFGGRRHGAQEQQPVEALTQMATLSSLRKEYALVATRAALAEALPNSSAASLTTTLAWREVFNSLLGAGLADEAIVLAQASAEHCELEVALTEAVRAMAEDCAKLQQTSGRASASLQVLTESSGSQRAPPSSSNPKEAWAQLRRHLEAVGDATPLGQRLCAAAAEAVFSTRRAMRLPQWLINMFELPQEGNAGMAGAGRDPAALLRIYLKYDKLREARDLVITMLQRWREVPFTKRQGGSWFAYNLIEILESRLISSGEDTSELMAQLQAVISLAKKDASVVMAA